jgi:ketosteroid isomerase-like protein
MTRPVHPDDLALVRQWFEQLAEHVRTVDFAGARRLFSEDLVAFGTFEDFVTGCDKVEQQQWRQVWPVTSGFRWRDDIRAFVSADRLSALGIGVFDSTGYHEDGTPFDRPGRATILFSRAAVGAPWLADHSHFSLFRDVPSHSYGRKL